MKRNLLFFCMALSSMAHAQFSGTYAPANWTITYLNINNSTAAASGTVNVSGAPNSILINGPNSGTMAYASIKYSIVVNQASMVSFNYTINNTDQDGFDFDNLFWGRNATMIDSVSATGSGTASFPVNAGDLLVIGVSANDDQLGPVIATISNFSVTATPLPVSGTALNIKAAGITNVLHWTTYMEDNNKGFEIQRSFDARTFTPIGFVPSHSATGHSKTALDYTFPDKNTAQPVVYYRYRQVDHDGMESYSNVVVMKQASATHQKVWSVYPNPVTKAQALSLNNRSEGTLKLFNAQGTLVHTQYVGKQAVLQLPAHLVAGTYFTVLQAVAGKQQTATLVIR
ncbi:MAG: T9SS type A sorting domain-containing protein [Taibaiella sp.]|nr:T9SS type A sorting domain-containing protein [Taibaiella sp.]